MNLASPGRPGEFASGIISDQDHRRLAALIESARYDAGLREDDLTAPEGELKRARVVPQSHGPSEVITMNSVVRVRDLDTEELDRLGRHPL